ncbi:MULTISPECIES: cupin domain-containing protein [unclassified Mesorhizobium]|uniref:(R)-mandelonitrile lyase n=1 Tax=unclassified Mesorhizobium TaxID=325217 RepID=UPI001FE0BEC9|nr:MULTISPECIES: cupin domain-containing protein [unclassified Mesorhizobium]
MKKLIASLILLLVLASAPAFAQTMEVSRNGSRASVPGPAANFTGTVTVTPLFAPNDSSSAGGGLVEFTPGARSAWHTHPAGQTLIVTEGTGWVQQEGGEKVEIKPGDVVWTEPGVKHWHGATDTTSLSHIAITPMADGKNVAWLEKVTDEQYAR